jgi:hypothetical protein
MRTAAFTRPQWLARGAAGRHARTRALEDRLATLWHHLTRRRGAGRRASGRRVNRTRSRLRHNQTPRWRRRLRGARQGGRSSRSGDTLFGYHRRAGTRRWRVRRRRRCRRTDLGRRRSFDLSLLWRFHFRLIEHSGSGAFDRGLGGLGDFMCRARVCDRRRRRPGRSDDGRRRTRHRLRRDESRSRLGFDRSLRRSSGCCRFRRHG